MRATRGGFTVIELLLVLVLGLLVIGAAVGMLVRQEQAYGQMRAMTGTQEDVRTGIELLSGELREVSAVGGDLLTATRDSVRFRALRKFGLVCDVDKSGKRLVVAQEGLDPFVAGDSVVVYVDQDTLQAADDIWQREYVTGASSPATCTNDFGSILPSILPNATLMDLTLQGAGLRFDSVFPGAPIREYETLTYGTGSWDGSPMLVMRTDKGGSTPLVGPLTDSAALVFRYFDDQGTELTALPLDAADRAAVHRVQVALRAQRWGDARNGMHRDSLITDVFLRGS